MKATTLIRIRAMSDAELAKVALKFAELYPDEFASFVEPPPSRAHRYAVPGTSSHVYLTDEAVAQIREAGTLGGLRGKIAAIKTLRTLIDLKLHEAKLMVEEQGWFLLSESEDHEGPRS